MILDYSTPGSTKSPVICEISVEKKAECDCWLQPSTGASIVRTLNMITGGAHQNKSTAISGEA